VTTTNHQLRPRFSLGQVVATSGVIQIIEDAGINPAALLRRHVSDDWGGIHPEDDGLNEGALETGVRILSVYGTADDPNRLWIITEADRSATTILRSEDY
jgi:hypothetical protein